MQRRSLARSWNPGIYLKSYRSIRSHHSKYSLNQGLLATSLGKTSVAKNMTLKTLILGWTLGVPQEHVRRHWVPPLKLVMQGRYAVVFNKESQRIISGYGSTITLRLKIAQTPYMIWSLGRNPLRKESLEPSGKGPRQPVNGPTWTDSLQTDSCCTKAANESTARLCSSSMQCTALPRKGPALQHPLTSRSFLRTPEGS